MNDNHFNIGDRVRWVRATGAPELKNAVGIITAVFPSDADIEDFAMYDVSFSSQNHTLYGTQIEAA